GCAACASALRSTFVEIRLKLPHDVGEEAPAIAETPSKGGEEVKGGGRLRSGLSASELKGVTDSLEGWAASGAPLAAEHVRALESLFRAVGEGGRLYEEGEEVEAVVEWCSSHLELLVVALRSPAEERTARAPPHLPSLLGLLALLARSSHPSLKPALLSHRSEPAVAERRKGGRGAAEGRLVGIFDCCIPLMLAHAGSPQIQKLQTHRPASHVALSQE
ncbi:MAG: hypothetical protein SGPRY_006276, partial [Prymnesium sp.]